MTRTCHLVAFAPRGPLTPRLAGDAVVALTHRAAFDLRVAGVPHRRHAEFAPAGGWSALNTALEALLPRGDELHELFGNFLVSRMNHDYHLAELVRGVMTAEHPDRCVLWLRGERFEAPERFAVVPRVLTRLGVPFVDGA